MKLAIGVGIILLCGVTIIGSAFAEPTTAPTYSKSELRQMIHDARSADQYRALASYFRSQQQKFEAQALSEKQEWDRRSQNVIGPAAKYPRPVDSSKNRYDYFTYEAAHMSQQATHYESLAADAR